MFCCWVLDNFLLLQICQHTSLLTLVSNCWQVLSGLVALIGISSSVLQFDNSLIILLSYCIYHTKLMIHYVKIRFRYLPERDVSSQGGCVSIQPQVPGLLAKHSSLDKNETFVILDIFAIICFIFRVWLDLVCFFQLLDFLNSGMLHFT